MYVHCAARIVYLSRGRGKGEAFFSPLISSIEGCCCCCCACFLYYLFSPFICRFAYTLSCWCFVFSARAKTELPWGSCNNYWNTKNCVNPLDRKGLQCFSQNATMTICTFNHVNVTASTLSDPVKEFWE